MIAITSDAECDYEFDFPDFAGAGDAAGSMLDQWVAELRGFAVGGDVDIDTDTATIRLFLSYSGSDEARQTGIVQLVDAASAASGARELVDLNARYEGRSIVIEGEGDIETVFALSEQQPSDATAAAAGGQEPAGW